MALKEMTPAKWNSGKLVEAQNVAKDFSVTCQIQKETKSGNLKVNVFRNKIDGNIEYETKVAKKTGYNEYFFNDGGSLNSYTIKL